MRCSCGSCVCACAIAGGRGAGAGRARAWTAALSRAKRSPRPSRPTRALPTCRPGPRPRSGPAGPGRTGPALRSARQLHYRAGNPRPVPRFRHTAGSCSDARIGPTSQVAFGLDARRWERGKRTPRGAASYCWTGPRTTTTPPRRLATSATVRLLRLGRKTRTVTVRPADPDTACRPPVGLGPDFLMRHSPDTARQPPGHAQALCPCFSRSRKRPASRRVPTVTESAGSVVVVAHPAGIGRGRSRAGYPCDGLLGHLTLCPPVCRPRDRVAADPSLPTRRCPCPACLPAGRQRGASAGLVHSDSPSSLREALSGLV
jgi:hypothetical protein